jgi:hypothetical protein
MAPAGQLWSTVDDLSRFAAALTGHHPAVLPPSTVDEMLHPVVVSDPDTWSHGYGLGLQLWRSGERVYFGHTGSMPGYLAVIVGHRRSGTVVIAFANTYTLAGSAIGRTGIALLDTVLEHEPPPGPAPRPRMVPSPAEVSPLLGRWWWMGREYDARWQASPSGDGLLVIAGPHEDWHFIPEPGEPDRWRGLTGEQAGEILAVLRDGSGAVAGLDIATFVFRREPMAD